MAEKQDVAYLIFDVEAVADGALISKVRYHGENLTASEAIARYRSELMDDSGKDVIPPTFMLPISVAVGKVDRNFNLLDVTTLDSPKYRPDMIAKRFWQGWQHYKQPTLVTFNGRGYDLPVLELAAFRYGLSLPEWFNQHARTYEQPRNRYNITAHLDLMDLFSNFGASRVSGGLNLLANLIGKPGKTGIEGSQIQDMFDAGRIDEINDYCQCDVLDTYFVFLRSRVLVGELSLEKEQEVMERTKAWLLKHQHDTPAFEHYMANWGDWEEPDEET